MFKYGATVNELISHCNRAPTIFLNIILKTPIRYGRSTSTESESDSYSNSFSKLRKTFVDSTVYVSVLENFNSHAFA